VIFYVCGAALILVYCAALAVLDAERHHQNANIRSFGDALWWAAETVSTVGYGEHYPVTTEGRFVAVGLMIGGVALIGAVSASFATWLIDRVRQVEDESQLTTRRDLMVLREQLDRIEHRLAEQADGAGSGSARRPADDQDRV
jgi:voltage-gated potassium channel